MSNGLRWTREEYDSYIRDRTRGGNAAYTASTDAHLKPLLTAGGGLVAPDRFVELCAAAGLPPPVCEVLIVPGRDFRADYCWPQHYIVVEQNGYRDHHSKKKLLRDWEKANLAQAAGWRYFQFSPKQLASVDTIEWLRVQLSRVE